MKRGFLIFLVILILQTIWMPEPKIRAEEGDLAETKSKDEIQKILKLRIILNTEKVEKTLREIGCECEWGKNVEDSELSRREAVCNATVHQMNQLKQAGIEFEVIREGIRIEKKRLHYEEGKENKGVVWGENGTNYPIPYQDWVYSPITITSAPAWATVAWIDVHFEVIHPYVGDLAIDLTDEDLEHQYRLWDYEGGSQNNIDTTIEYITFFNGESVNQTWKLYGWDCCEEDDGYIDYWWIQIWYQEDLPDLIVQSLTATDYNPNTGEYIDVTMVIKNQGTVSASGWFYNGLFYNLPGPPGIDTLEDDFWSTLDLDPGQTETHTFYNVTSYEAGAWHMYGLADCDGDITETNENNNYIGPVTINWTYVPPDLMVQDLTVDNPSLYITEHTNGTITIKNQSSVPITEGFRTDVFNNRPTVPSPPASGQYRWQTYSLNPGETRTYNFYKLPHSTSAGTWRMWGLVDSQGDVQETNESNNAYGPVNITWLDTFSLHEVSRADMIAHALEFVNVDWTCSGLNATPHWSCPSWTCAFSPGQHDTGEAYSWGGWDMPDDFLTYLSAGLRAGARQGNTCGEADPYWATGTDCSGLVSRCWESPVRKDCFGLVYVSDQITTGELQSGDIMNRTGEHAHVMMFYEWVIPNSRMRVIEATPPHCRTWPYDTTFLVNQGYVPRRYKWVDDPGNNNPEFADSLFRCKYPYDECNDCVKYGESFTLEVDAYDPDGDPIYYEWISYNWGWFIVNGTPTYICTTYENFVTYQAPGFPHTWDQLQVTVYDDRGGWAFTEGWLGVYDPGTNCLCGDVSDDGSVDIADVVKLVNYLYCEQDPPYPLETGDVSNDCVVDMADIVYLINYLFEGGPLPECGWICPSEKFTEFF